jgi:alanyl-tRNA synthetase
VTERLYYTDPYLAEFDATVLRVEPRDSRFVAVLDRTAFYPTSGGQPFDTGRLGGARVLDVVDEDGTIAHVLDAAIPTGAVHGGIDWDRRFEHMQQHTGQHVLSAAFDRLLHARTESFHLGTGSSTIDLNRAVTPAEVQRVEQEANRIVWEDRPVAIRFADALEASQLPLRKESARAGVLRIIDVEGYDVSACGGTHVARTGAIGTIAVASLEKFRGGTRVEFLCGVRALRGYTTLREAVAASVKLVSVLPAELPAAIERLQADARDAKKQVKDLQSRVAVHEAAAMAERAEAVGPIRVVVEVLDGWDANGLKSLAGAIAERPGYVAALIGLPAPSPVVIAAAPDSGIDAAAALKRLVDQFGGKGGGRPQLAQGGGLQGAAEDIVGLARASIAGQTPRPGSAE